MKTLVFALIPFWLFAADLQDEIDAVAAKGGGRVVVRGICESRPLTLKSHVTLELAEGAVLMASTNLSDYATEPGSRCFIHADGAEDVAIVGTGSIDGRGYAFRETRKLDGASQPKSLPVMMRFSRCRNVRLEGFTYRRCGAWGCHLRNCDGVVMRRVKCHSHVNNTNDGIDIESANVTIEDCDIDSDDDALCFKTESDVNFAVTNVVVRNCRLASCCNAIKFGTGSYSDIRDIRIENCELVRASDNYRFSWYKTSPGVTNRICGLAGLALEVVDGGRMEDVTIRNITMQGYQTPIFIRHDRRHEPPAGRETYLRNVLIENVRGRADSQIACSVTGVAGRRPQNVVLRNLDLEFPGGGLIRETIERVPECVGGYPEMNMFRGRALPAFGFYIRHADGVRLENVSLRTAAPDRRPAVVRVDSPATGMRLAPIFADHMVLAAGKPVRVFGTGIGTARVSFRGVEATAESKGGSWCVELPAGAAGGPYELTVRMNGRTQVVRDVMVGMVIMLAGQSNMQFKLAESSSDPATWQGNPNIRSFTTRRLEKGEPYSPDDGWVSLEKPNAGKWSAIGYEMAIRLAAAKGCAVGVVNCYQGASAIQAWLDAPMLADRRFELPEGGKWHWDVDCQPYWRWNCPGTLYREQFGPIVPYAMSGVVWYQGESNTGLREGEVYERMLPTMIGLWRRDLRDETLPFAVVQLADLVKRRDAGWRRVQEAQVKVAELCPNVKTVRSADVCESDGIHPKTKSRLAARLVDAVLSFE